MLLLDKLQLMVKLKAKIYELKQQKADEKELKRLENLLKRLNTSSHTLDL